MQKVVKWTVVVVHQWMGKNNYMYDIVIEQLGNIIYCNKIQKKI